MGMRRTKWRPAGGRGQPARWYYGEFIELNFDQPWFEIYDTWILDYL